MIKRMTWFVGGAVAGVAGMDVAKRKMKQAATHLTPKNVVHSVTDRVRDAFAEGRRGDARQRDRAAGAPRRSGHHTRRRSRRGRRGAGRRPARRARSGHRAQAGPRSKRRSRSSPRMSDTLVAELGRGAVARSRPRRRRPNWRSTSAMPRTSPATPASCASRRRPTRCRRACRSPCATAGRSSPAVPARVSPVAPPRSTTPS